MRVIVEIEGSFEEYLQHIEKHINENGKIEIHLPNVKDVEVIGI